MVSKRLIRGTYMINPAAGFDTQLMKDASSPSSAHRIEKRAVPTT
jgi:hypothetical protein